MIRSILTFHVIAFAALFLSSPVHACGTPESDCSLAGGTYRIALPEGVPTPPVVVYLHGAGGRAAGVMKNTGMIEAFRRRGYAVLAPQGVDTKRRFSPNWAVNDGRDHPRDDVDFVGRVIEDAAARHGIDTDRVLLTGFSRGASMVWDIACTAPETATAYVAIAGAFWEPLPRETGCAAPVDLYHIHGWTDRVVPLEGRSLRGGAVVQGDVFQSLFLLRATNGCTARQPDSAPMDETPGYWMRSWTDCTSGARIDFALHPGGHMLPRGWIARAMDWFEARIAKG